MSSRRSNSLDPEQEQNAAALASCAGPHRFVLIRQAGEGASRARYRCELCGGLLTDPAVHWHNWARDAGYRRGHEDGRKEEYGRGLEEGLRHAERHYKAELERLTAKAGEHHAAADRGAS